MLETTSTQTTTTMTNHNISVSGDGNHIDIINNNNNVCNNTTITTTSSSCCLMPHGVSSSSTNNNKYNNNTNSNWMDVSDMIRIQDNYDIKNNEVDDDDDNNEEKMEDESHNKDVDNEQQITLHPTELLTLFEDFMHFGSVGLHIVDDKGIILWANQAELDLLGYTKEEYFGQPISIIHSNMNCLTELLTILLSGSQVKNYIAPVKTKDGRIEYVQVNSSMRLNDGHRKTTRCFSAVVTDRVLREQAIMEAHAQKCEAAILKEQTERKTIFLRRLCHELRNPLQGIKGNLDLLMEELQDLKNQVRTHQGNSTNKNTSEDEEKTDVLDINQLEQRIDNAIEYAESAYHAAEHQMLVINETLSLARLESEQDGLESFNSQSINMNDIVRQVHSIMGVKAFEKGIDVQYNVISDNAKRICTDPCWLKQILINLISNAIKFTFEGRVVITIDTCQYNSTTNNNSNQKSCTDNNIALKVTVKDDGIGMTIDEQKKLFGAFAQANDNIVTEYGGSGLGLNIIQQMLGHIGGSIEIIESAKDVGSTFQFIMPCEIIIPTDVDSNDDTVNKNLTTSPLVAEEEKTQENVLDNTTITTTPSNNNETITSLSSHNVNDATTTNITKNNININKDNVRILIVDDSPMNLKILSNFLRKNGYTKHEMAQHGKEAYEMHHNNPYDLILTDIDMPYMDGLELTKQIRSRERMILLNDDSSDHRSDRKLVVPIIGISGNVLPEDSALATEVGMNDYVGKPYRFPMIEALIEKHIFRKNDDNNICLSS